MLGVLVRSLRRNGVVVLDDAQSTRPCQMNPATIDRRLASRRDLLSSKGRSYTKPGTLLKSQIPIRTWSEWDEGRPGFVEIDLVGHQGDNPLGEFSFTLTMTDVYSGFIINRSVKNKAAVHVTAAIDYAGKKFPFLILGIDSDSWSEFINAHLRLLQRQQAHLHPVAPFQKERWSTCRAEERTHVRELVGYRHRLGRRVGGQDGVTAQDDDGHRPRGPLWRRRYPADVSDPTVLPDSHLSEVPVHIETDTPALQIPPPVLAVDGEPTGETTTTDSRSQRTRTSRRGGHLLTRARSPSFTSACPICVSPGHPLLRMVAPYFVDRSTQPWMTDDLGISECLVSFIADTNPIESTFSTVRLRTKVIRGRGRARPG
jgi:hypothetical protein